LAQAGLAQALTLGRELRTGPTMTTRSLPLAVLCAACCYAAAASGQECWGMGETCGDDARCSGMDTRCGDRSECSGSSSRCGANSVCSGIDSQCGPGSQCSGLGAQCAGGGQQEQSEGEKPMHFKKMKPMHFKKMKPMHFKKMKPMHFKKMKPMHFKKMKPMHFKKMHFKKTKTEQPQQVFVHGCDQGDVCSGRPDAAQSNGVTVCCQEGCGKCSASTSQSGDVLTATCVCSGSSPAPMKPMHFKPMKPMKPMHFKPMKPMKPMHFKPMKPMKPMHFKPMKPMHFEPVKTEQPQKVFVHGCDQGDVCSGRPDAAQSNGVTVCCQEGCGKCSASTSQSGDVLTATCVCSAPAATTTEQPEQPKPVKAMGCEMGDVCTGRPGAAQTAGMDLCCPESCPSCMVYGEQQGGELTAMCMCLLSAELAEEPSEPRAGAEARARGLPAAATFAAAALTLGAGCAWALAVVAGRLRPCEARQPLLSA